jgi:hypothetical protein
MHFFNPSNEQNLLVDEQYGAEAEKANEVKKATEDVDPIKEEAKKEEAEPEVKEEPKEAKDEELGDIMEKEVKDK